MPLLLSRENCNLISQLKPNAMVGGFSGVTEWVDISICTLISLINQGFHLLFFSYFSPLLFLIYWYVSLKFPPSLLIIDFTPFASCPRLFPNPRLLMSQLLKLLGYWEMRIAVTKWAHFLLHCCVGKRQFFKPALFLETLFWNRKLCPHAPRNKVLFQLSFY